MKTESNLSDLLPQLLERLRHELRQYGEMLALLDQQQEFVMARSADHVLASVAVINEQMARIQTARQQREITQSAVAGALPAPADSAFASLLPRLPENYRAAVSALVHENNELLGRVQQRARQNHLLLSRSVELMQRFINSLMPSVPPVTYNGDGQLQGAGVPAQALYQAVG